MTIVAEGHWLLQHWAAIAIALTLFSLVAFVVILLGKYIRICINIFTENPPPVIAWAPDFPRVSGEEVRFRSFDGTSLRGMLLRTVNRAGCKGTIVFCHEYGSDMFSCARYARPLVEAGFDVFTFDFRGHGQSSKGGRYRPLQWPSDKDMEDVLGACAHVESMLAGEGRPTEIGLFGISRGAGSALLAASTDPSVKAIVCDGAFNTETTLVALMKRWASIFARIKLVYQNHSDTFWRSMLWIILRLSQPKMGCRYLSVRRALREMKPRPILFIHGEKDSYIRVEQTQILYDAAPTPKYLWIVPGAKHNQSVVLASREYAARTVAFFRRHLAEEAVAEVEITAPAITDVA